MLQGSDLALAQKQGMLQGSNLALAHAPGILKQTLAQTQGQ